MRQLLLFLGSLVCLMRPNAGLVPLPAKSTSGSLSLALSQTFEIRTTGPHAGALLAAAFRRIEDIIFAHGGRTTAPLPQGESLLASLVVNIADDREDAPQLGDDESYRLTITAGRSAFASLNAPRLQGALHGLQTFAQLCRYDYDQDYVAIDQAPWNITDAPRFAHRGLMLDTSRHFYPPRAILPLLDAMATVKLNVFHW